MAAVPKANRLFDALSADGRERLRPYADLVDLSKGRVLCEAGEVPRYAFFPLNGMVSLLASTDEGQAVEVAMVGRDGFVGVPILLDVRASPYQVVVQIECTAIRVRADAVAREFRRREELHTIALTYIHGLIQELVQSAVCLSFHTITQPLCRWLLVSRDCVQSNTIELTQEFVAQMLGVSRPKVSRALVILEEKRLIHQGHGRIHIVDAVGLERSSCPCHHAAAPRQDAQSVRRGR